MQRSETMKKNVLVIAPDAALRAALARALMAAGHAVELAEGAKRARELMAAGRRIDLGVLAAGALSGRDHALARELAEKAGALIIAGVASPAGSGLRAIDNAEVLASTEVGEILARVEEALQRASSAGTGDRPPEALSVAGMTIDLGAHAVLDGAGREIALTRAEFALMAAFARAPGRALSRDHLRMAITGDGAEAYDRSIDVLVWRLRQKIEPDPKAPSLVVTVPGVGYKLAAPPRPLAAAAASPAPPATGPEPPDPQALPDTPSIAVLPFQNMSGDAEQEYFADGVVEDIITALSRFRSLFVIARNSSFTYKGRAVDIKQVGRELGVRYVLEGSVRRAAARVRIAAQLIDAASGAHLWAERFDGGIADIFDLQDEVAAGVAGAIAPKLEQAEIERARRKPTGSLDAYDLYLRGMAHLYRWSRDGSEAALDLFYRAIELDADFALPPVMAARCQVWRRANGWWADPARDAEETLRLARRALELGRDDASVLADGAFALLRVADDADAAAIFIDRALAINSNHATAWHFSSWIRVMLGEPEVALDHARRAMRLSPVDPLKGQMQVAAAFAHYCAGRYAEASSWAERAVRDLPSWPLGLAIAAASGALAGRQDAAQRAVSRLSEAQPRLGISRLNDLYRLRRPEDAARWEEGLRQAGLPE